MKKLALLALAALTLHACGSDDPVAPAEVDELFDTIGVLAYDAAGLSGPGLYLAGLHRLPDELKPTADQLTAIKAALAAFGQATKAGHEALAALHKAAREAHEAGRSRAEIRKILEQGDAIRRSLEQAEKTLLAAIEAILTPAQKAWLDAHLPRRCDPRSIAPLTDEQKTQIRAIIAEYEENHRADLAAIRAAHEKARDALRNGASRDEIKAILDSVRAAVERLGGAQKKLQEAIQAVLTPAQRASGCYRGLLSMSSGRG